MVFCLVAIKLYVYNRDTWEDKHRFSIGNNEL